jgi:hypothetical protein
MEKNELTLVAQRDQFVSYLFGNCDKLYGLSFNEVLLLVVHQGKIFNVQSGGYCVDFLQDAFRVSEENLNSKIMEAKKARDYELQKAQEDSFVKYLETKLRYLLFDVHSLKSADKVFGLICRYGDSAYWDSLIVGQVDSVTLRRKKIPDLLDTPEVFDRVILELGNSKRALQALAEFSKRSGSPWDKSLKY